MEFIGMVFETFVIIISCIVALLIVKKYLEKKHKLTLILLIVFITLIFSVIFSWFSKILSLYSGIDYLRYGNTLPDPGTVNSWILLRIFEFRISFVFISIAIIMSFVLHIKLFETNYSRNAKLVRYIFAIIAILYSIIVYVKGNIILNAITFLIVSLLMFFIYFPFGRDCFISFKSSKEKRFKMKFLSLVLMSAFFIMLLLMFFFDRITIMLGGEGFSIFYFLGWIFAALGIISAYIGYIRPISNE